MDLKLFRNPPSQYRSAPFWSWNDRLTDEELARQVHLFHTVGIGGFFMHSRVGLLTPYLSKEWMQRIRATVAAARARGMKAWLYDEDTYPSGHAGGRVPALGAACRCKTLKHELAPERPPMRDGTVAVYRVRLDAAGRPVSAVRDDGLPPAPGEHFLHCYWAIPAPSGWYNDATYIDTLNRDAADAFLRITHDAYADALGDDLGDTVPGIFADEPRLAGGMAWTESFPAEFRARKGYDIRDHLPALLYRIGSDWPKARYDYWDVVTDLFLEHFCRPIHDWCEARGIALTGHFWEHTYPSPESQGDFLAPLATMQLPGIDCLGYARPEKPQTQFGYVAMCKEASSVAHQLGRKQVLSEAYGGAGWDFSFADMKWYWDWHLVLGVNLLCQHLSLYSLRGCRKRDYPPSFQAHQPWWHEYRVLGDYVGRMGYALSQGRFAADTLVLHPCEGSWVEHDPLDPAWAAPRRKAALDALWDLTTALTELKCDYDLGSERLMATGARVRDGQLRMGKQSYRVVVLPRMISMRGTTLALLSRFVEAGGTVVVTGETPRYLDGGRSRIAERFFRQKPIVRCRPTRAALARCLGTVVVTGETPRYLDGGAATSRASTRTAAPCAAATSTSSPPWTPRRPTAPPSRSPTQARSSSGTPSPARCTRSARAGGGSGASSSWSSRPTPRSSSPSARPPGGRRRCRPRRRRPPDASSSSAPGPAAASARTPWSSTSPSTASPRAAGASGGPSTRCSSGLASASASTTTRAIAARSSGRHTRGCGTSGRRPGSSCATSSSRSSPTRRA